MCTNLQVQTLWCTTTAPIHQATVQDSLHGAQSQTLYTQLQVCILLCTVNVHQAKDLDYMCTATDPGAQVKVKVNFGHVGGTIGITDSAQVGTYSHEGKHSLHLNF